jgi:hypothetical protein
VVGVRCGNSITEEKRRKTWEDLLLTALPLEEIKRGKKWGVLQATVPYLVAYSLPMFALAALERGSELIVAAAWLLGTCMALLGVAAVCIELSEVEEVPTRPRTHRLPPGSTCDWGPGS